MLGRVRDETLSAIDAQEQFNSTSEQHRQFVETFSASVSSTLDKTFSSVTGALAESVGALIDGEKSPPRCSGGWFTTRPNKSL